MAEAKRSARNPLIPDPSRPWTGLPVLIRHAAARARLPLYLNALLLIGNTGLIAALGFVFWALAARLYPPDQVGLASAAISSAGFVAGLSQLGLPYALIRFSPYAGAGRRLLTSTIVVAVTIVSAAAGAVFVGGISEWAPDLWHLAPPAAVATAVIAIAAATAVSTVLVYVAVGIRDARPALAGGLAQGVVKCALILAFVPAASGLGFAVVLAWLLGTVVGVVLQGWSLRDQLIPRVDVSVLRLRSLVRYSAGNYLGDIAWTAPGLLFPLIVVTLLSAEENAYFYVAWALASLVAGVPTAVASSLLAEASHTDHETALHLRRAFRLTLGLVIPAILVCWIGAPLLLGLFGAQYAANGADTLRILSLAALPFSFNMLFLTIARVDRDVPRILVITVATGGGSLVASLILARGVGAPGIALAYLVAHTLVALVVSAEWWSRGRWRDRSTTADAPQRGGQTSSIESGERS